MAGEIALMSPAPDAMIATGLPTCFDMRDVLCELLDQRQMLGKWRQAWIWRAMDLLRRRRADRDQRGIDSVVLGPLQVKLRVGAHLRRLKNNHHKTVAAQLGDRRLCLWGRLRAISLRRDDYGPCRQA